MKLGQVFVKRNMYILTFNLPSSFRVSLISTGGLSPTNLPEVSTVEATTGDATTFLIVLFEFVSFLASRRGKRVLSLYTAKATPTEVLEENLLNMLGGRYTDASTSYSSRDSASLKLWLKTEKYLPFLATVESGTWKENDSVSM